MIFVSVFFLHLFPSICSNKGPSDPYFRNQLVSFGLATSVPPHSHIDSYFLSLMTDLLFDFLAHVERKSISSNCQNFQGEIFFRKHSVDLFDCFLISLDCLLCLFFLLPIHLKGLLIQRNFRNFYNIFRYGFLRFLQLPVNLLPSDINFLMFSF